MTYWKALKTLANRAESIRVGTNGKGAYGSFIYQSVKNLGVDSSFNLDKQIISVIKLLLLPAEIIGQSAALPFL